MRELVGREGPIRFWRVAKELPKQIPGTRHGTQQTPMRKKTYGLR